MYDCTWLFSYWKVFILESLVQYPCRSPFQSLYIIVLITLCIVKQKLNMLMKTKHFLKMKENERHELKRNIKSYSKTYIFMVFF